MTIDCLFQIRIHPPPPSKETPKGVFFAGGNGLAEKCRAGKAVIVVVIEPHARITILVERTARHTVPADYQPALFGGVRRRDDRLDGFDPVHRITPL